MPKSFDIIPDHILDRIFGALSPTDWRNARRVCRRFDRRALQLHRSAVRSLKLELSYDSTQISWNNFKETPMRCKVSAIAYLGVGPFTQGITAIDLRNHSVPGAVGLERMIKKFMPLVVHVQIVPPFAQNLSTAGGHIYQKTESDWSHVAAMRHTFQLITFLRGFCQNFTSLDVWLALGCYREDTDRNDYHAAVLNEWGFLRSLTLRVLLVEAALSTARVGLGTEAAERERQLRAIEREAEERRLIEEITSLSAQVLSPSAPPPAPVSASTSSGSESSSASSSGNPFVTAMIDPEDFEVALMMAEEDEELAVHEMTRQQVPPPAAPVAPSSPSKEKKQRLQSPPEQRVMMYQRMQFSRHQLLSSRHRAVSEVRRRRSANVNEFPELLTKLPTTLDSLTLEAHCRLDSQCIINIEMRCPNLRKFTLGAVMFRMALGATLDLQPLADQLTHLAVIKSPIPWASFSAGPQIFPNVQIFDISLGDLLQPSVDFIRSLPQMLPDVRILRIAVSHGQSADLTGDWMWALRAMKRLRELYVGSENRCLRQTSAPSGDPLLLTDDRLHRLELAKSLEVLSMPFARNLSKFALMGLVTKYPNLRRLYIPISLDLQDLLFFQHYALAWSEHGPDRQNLSIFVREIEVLPAVYKQFKQLLPESLRVHFVAFQQPPTYCECRMAKMTRSLVFWTPGATGDASSSRLEITNACPETKEEYFCQMVRPELTESGSPDGLELVDLA